jgi:cytochrome c biogenesis protein CcmG/thiol:disulfide interchange protein DsbE
VPRSLKLALNVLAVGLVAALIGVFAWQQAHGSRAAAPTGRMNEPAPGFELDRFDGNGKLSLAALRGHPVIVNFWATWCEPCKKESAELERTYRRYRGNGLVVVGVDTSDFKGDIAGFARKYDLSYPILLRGDRVSLAYGVDAIPESFFVSRTGRLVWHVAGGINASDAFHQSFEQGLAALRLNRA